MEDDGDAYTLAVSSGLPGSETVTLPPLTSAGNPDHGLFNAVVVADSPLYFAAGQLSALFSYETTFVVRQLDGFAFPGPSFGLTEFSSVPLGGTVQTLTAAGLAALPALKGPVPFDVGSNGYPATVASSLPAGASFTPYLLDPSGHVLMGVYQHPVSTTDPQSGVAELVMDFNYTSAMLHWLILAPGLIDWVTHSTHLGLYRNYFGQDVDDTFLADNQWSSQYQCTPGATDPPDYTCPAGVANNPADTPADAIMSASDVAYVAAWEKATGITLSLAFNASAACTAPSAGQESSADCTGSATVGGTTYTDPGQALDPSAPSAAATINALLADQGSFNWTNHTWSHQFLGCVDWQALPVTSVTVNPAGGSMAAGSYDYEVTAATAYGESEPSVPLAATVAADGSVTLTWPEAPNGVGTDGTPGPTLAQERASHTGGTGFWGYNVYREAAGSSVYGLVGQVAEAAAPTASSTYTFTDNGAKAPGAAPGSAAGFPTATNPGIGCAAGAGSWEPATSTSPDSSIEQEIGLDIAFAANNGLTPGTGLANYSPAVVITGEHSGLENPNMPSALTATGITTFAADASRQPVQYPLGTAVTAPRYPSNIYYNAATWAEELNEYNTLYVAEGVSLGDPNAPGAVGRCTATSNTTCLTAPATQADLLASESRIELGHMLANDPRVGYAHQTDLIGPAGTGYTLLTFLDDVLAQYNSWYQQPVTQVTDATEAGILAEQAAWSAARTAGTVTATQSGGTVTLTNNGTGPVAVPLTAPTGSTTSATSFGEAYGGSSSAWTTLSPGATLTVTVPVVVPAVTSAASATATAGTAFSFKVTTTGTPLPTLIQVGTLPVGITFTNNGDGTATFAGTAAAGTGGTYLLALGATNPAATATQNFTLTVLAGPLITSASAATSVVGLPFSFAVTTSGSFTAALSESGTLPPGLAFKDNCNGTATISGTPPTEAIGAYAVTVTATNTTVDSFVTLTLNITVQASTAALITSVPTAYFNVGTGGAFAVTATGVPAPVLAESGALPTGLTFADNHNGTALLSGTTTRAGSYSLMMTATNVTNGITNTNTQAFTLIVDGAPAITSPNAATATVGTPVDLSVTTTGYPPPAITATGTLPAGLSLRDNGNGTATIIGTPAAGSAGSYTIGLKAVNFVGTASQNLALSVAVPSPTAFEDLGCCLAPGSGPAAASWGSGRLDIVVRGTDNAVWHKWYAGAWSGFESLGGVTLDNPAAVSWAPGRLDVFVRGTDNQLWHRWYTGTWSAWEPLGGTLTSAPTVASWGAGRLDVFARGAGNQLIHKWYAAGTWSAWESLGGTLTSSPGTTSWGPGRIDVVVRGTDNAVYHKWYQGAWSGWEPLSGAVAGAPQLSSQGPGRLDLFAQGLLDGALYHRSYDQGWSPWAYQGGGISGPPGSASWAPGRIDIFVDGLTGQTGLTGHLMHAWSG